MVAYVFSRRTVAGAVLSLGLFAAGCGDSGSVPAGSVLLTVEYGADVPANQVAATHTLVISVDGAETYQTSELIQGQLSAGPVTVRYRPAVKSGTLHFTASGDDVGGMPIGTGEVSVTINTAGETYATIVLEAGQPMVDGGGLDLVTVQPDLSGMDASGIDQTVVHDMTAPPDQTVLPDLTALPDQTVLPDLVVPDDLTVIPPDMVMFPDMVSLPDMVQLPDLVSLPDMVSLPDLVQLPDLVMIPFVPSHVNLTAYKPNAGDLSSVTAIDTTNLLLNNGQLAVPAGGSFAADGNNNAVLSIGKWKIGAAVSVTGTRRLVVIAAGDVTVGGIIHASAVSLVAGPGGAASEMGTGAGGTGDNVGQAPDPGGGGAGFATTGGQGGACGGFAGYAGGATYGPLMTDWNAGSGGGDGSYGEFCNGNPGKGGAGGGAVQISSATSITVTNMGGIDANGGGGTGGCLLADATGGGGGGSGGEIFLESPTVSVAGGLYANGGGGGAAGNFAGTGANGSDGQSSTTAATGGVGANNGGTGGAGGTNVAPTAGQSINTTADGGGGGGAAGRIWLRTRNVAATLTGTSSPSPNYNTTL